MIIECFEEVDTTWCVKMHNCIPGVPLKVMCPGLATQEKAEARAYALEFHYVGSEVQITPQP